MIQQLLGQRSYCCYSYCCRCFVVVDVVVVAVTAAVAVPDVVFATGTIAAVVVAIATPAVVSVDNIALVTGTVARQLFSRSALFTHYCACVEPQTWILTADTL